MMTAEDTIAMNENVDVFNPVDFAKIRVGVQTLEDAVVDVSNYKKLNPNLGDKQEVLRAIHQGDFEKMRDISNFFFKTSGIYSKLCIYMAFLYRYDWMVTPYINSDSLKEERILDGFDKVLNHLDNFGVKKFCGDVALKVIRNGCFYGYIIHQKDRDVVQELPPKYCRSRFSVNGKPAVEFNLRFFDDMFKDTTQKMKMLNLFPHVIIFSTN